MSARDPILVTRWASQSGRRRAGLEPGYAVLNRREPQDLLAFAPAFARHVRYFDVDDRPDGDWSDLFLADSATLLATIAHFNSSDRLAEFTAVLHRLRHEAHHGRKLELFEQLFQLTLHLFREVDRWLSASESMRAGTAGPMLRAHLSGTVGAELAVLLARLRGYAMGAGQPGSLGQSVQLDLRGFHPAWRISLARPDGAIYHGHFRWQKIDSAIDPLRTLFEEALDVVSDLSERAKADFQTSFDDPHHSPHIALYMAFAKQYCAATEQFDALIPSFVDFYYRDILDEPVRAPQPDQMFLTFTLASRPGLTAATVPAGTQFPAGADADGHPIVFAADQALSVTAAKLACARTLRKVRGPLYDGMPLDASSKSAADRLHMVLEADVGLANFSPNGWPLFGAPAEGTAGAAASVPARLGFAIASQALLLTGGIRTLTLRLALSAQSDAMLESLLEPAAAAAGVDANVVLVAVLSAALRLKLSVASGWLEVPTFRVEVSNKTSARRITLDIKLPATAPPIVAQDAIAGVAAEPVSGFPTLWAELSQAPVSLKGVNGAVAIHPLALLDGLSLGRVIIETEVTDLPWARGGALVPPDSSPFMPFASPALVGTGFDVAQPELFAKTPTRLTLKIDWLGLPAHPLGFAGYYAQYVVGPDREKLPHPIDNRSFQADLTLVGDSPWQLPTGAKAVYLFRTDDKTPIPEPQGKIAATTRIEIAPVPAESAGMVGSLRVTLSEPAFGFGDELYQSNILNAVEGMLDIASDEALAAPIRGFRKLRCRFVAWLKRLLRIKSNRPAAQATPDPAAAAPAATPTMAQVYPNPPWRPQISRISIDYKATAEVPLGQPGQFFHLAPSGPPMAVAADLNGCISLLPSLTAQACLDLGFTGLGPSQPLTLLFQFAAETGLNAHIDPGGVRWFAEGRDGWSELSGTAVQLDGTSGFKHAGILSLRLPALAKDADGLAWLRLIPRTSAPDALNQFPSVVSIAPHALTATRVIQSNSKPDVAVPPKSVKAPSPAIVSLATVDQPLASFGGRAGEAPATLPIRVGERMRHKQRASLSWDYERLVLERFPEIAKVQVLPALDERSRPASGHVLVIVVPEPSPVDASDPLLPRTHPEVRGRIADALAQIASPFARIHVVDPVYVRLFVQAGVLFRHDAETDAPIRLDEDLRNFLSPRSDELALLDDAKPRDLAAAVANFIGTRRYVAGLVELELTFSPDIESVPWCVLTSAPQHEIRDLGPGFADDPRGMRIPAFSQL
jgi:hypothetical protein